MESDKYEAFILQEDSTSDGQAFTRTEDAAIALNELCGKDMSWYAYHKITDAILRLDEVANLKLIRSK